LLEDGGEEGMIHSVLSSFPDLFEQTSYETSLVSDEFNSVYESFGKEGTGEDFSPLGTDDKHSTMSISSRKSSNEATEPPTSEPIPYPAPLDNSIEYPDPVAAESPLHSSISPADIPLPPSRPSTPPSPSHSISAPATRSRPQKSLPLLLRHADELMALYPPSHPDLKLNAIIGPASAFRTWSENPAHLPSDAAAVQFVVSGVDIVYPEEPEPEPDLSPESDLESDIGSDADEPIDEKRWFGLRHRKATTSAKENKGRKQSSRKEKKRRHKLLKRRQHVFGGLVVERRTLFAGAVLVLGVAMAVSLYGGTGSMRGSGTSRMGAVGVLGAGERLWSILSGAAGFGF
jgi:TBC1 domain family member 20